MKDLDTLCIEYLSRDENIRVSILELMLSRQNIKNKILGILENGSYNPEFYQVFEIRMKEFDSLDNQLKECMLSAKEKQKEILDEVTNNNLLA